MLTDLIKAQLYECIIMLAAGILTGILRDAYELVAAAASARIRSGIKKEKLKGFVSVILEWIGEIAFFAAAGIAVFAFLYYCCYGEISFHAFASFVIGVFLWKKVFCAIIE